MAVRPDFDPKGDYVAARNFTFLGREYDPGAAFPHPDDLIAPRMVAQQYNARAISMVMTSARAEAPLVSVTYKPIGNYEIAAPWLEQPVKVRGQKKAEAAQAELLAQEPLSYGGVTVEGADDAWNVRSAWGDDAETLTSEDAARARARTIRKAGPPKGWVPAQT